MRARREYRQIVAVLLLSAAVAAALVVARQVVPPAVSPRVHVRWADAIGDAARGQYERALKLAAGEHREGSTWAYDLVDPSPRSVQAIVTHPAVRDTHYIDRIRGRVAPDAPPGTTPIGNALSAPLASGAASFLQRLSIALAVLSAIWLATSGRRLRTPPQDDPPHPAASTATPKTSPHTLRPTRPPG